jgi:DNA-binding MarR family transcriptional regulator
MTEPSPSHDAGFEIDRVVHEPARLLILSHLYVVEWADFLFLLHRTGLTRGNLSSHMSRREAAGYVEVKKTFVAKRTRTVLRLTELGRAAFDRYVARMKGLLDEVSARQPAGGVLAPALPSS